MVPNYSDSDASKIKPPAQNTTKQKPWCIQKHARKKIFSSTVGLKYLETLDDFDIERVDRRANKWDLPTGGDKRNNHKVSSAVEVGNTIKNPFTHTLSDEPICVLLSALSALWTAGFKDTAKLLLETQRDKLR